MKTSPEIAALDSHSTDQQLVLEAANDNPGGATSAAITLEKLACLMARAYVASLRKEEEE